MRPDEVIVPPAVVVIELGVVSPPVAVIRLAADNVPDEVRIAPETVPVADNDATLRAPAVALTASHWLSAADQTTKIVSPVDREIVLKGTPLLPTIWPLPALETTIGFVIFVALI